MKKEPDNKQLVQDNNFVNGIIAFLNAQKKARANELGRLKAIAKNIESRDNLILNEEENQLLLKIFGTGSPRNIDNLKLLQPSDMYSYIDKFISKSEDKSDIDKLLDSNKINNGLCFGLSSLWSFGKFVQDSNTSDANNNLHNIEFMKKVADNFRNFQNLESVTEDQIKNMEIFVSSVIMLQYPPSYYLGNNQLKDADKIFDSIYQNMEILEASFGDKNKRVIGEHSKKFVYDELLDVEQILNVILKNSKTMHIISLEGKVGRHAVALYKNIENNLYYYDPNIGEIKIENVKDAAIKFPGSMDELEAITFRSYSFDEITNKIDHRMSFIKESLTEEEVENVLNKYKNINYNPKIIDLEKIKQAIEKKNINLVRYLHNLSQIGTYSTYDEIKYIRQEGLLNFPKKRIDALLKTLNDSEENPSKDIYSSRNIESMLTKMLYYNKAISDLHKAGISIPDILEANATKGKIAKNFDLLCKEDERREKFIAIFNQFKEANPGTFLHYLSNPKNVEKIVEIVEQNKQLPYNSIDSVFTKDKTGGESVLRPKIIPNMVKNGKLFLNKIKLFFR